MMRILVTIATLGALAASGCQASAPADKAGGDTVALRLATIDLVNNNGQSFGPQAFVRGLEAVSGGRLKVEIVSAYGDGAATAESDLVEAIANGEIDGGWPSTRAFAAAGIHGLEAVEAPMTITSYAAQRALVESDLDDQLLANLDGSGVVGLGLTVGPLRRPFASGSALVALDDWDGVRFRTYNSPVQAAAIESFGGVPVNAGFEWVEKVDEGTLRGAEFDIAQAERNDIGTVAGNLTSNVVLWPKMFVLSLSEKTSKSLTDEQRGWVQEAADLAVQASVDSTYDEDTVAEQLCSEGGRLKEASPADILALRTALTPVFDRLAADPNSGQLLSEIQAVAVGYPEPDVPQVGDGCQRGQAETTEIGPIPKTQSTIPDGVYRVEITTDEMAAAGLDNEGGNSGTWTLTIENGRWEFRCQPIDDPGLDCGHEVYSGRLDWGELRGTGHTAYFVSEHGYVFGGTWSVDGDELLFDDPIGEVEYQLVLNPWQRIE